MPVLFQSPIYGSRTTLPPVPFLVHLAVSIPYLRVTHTSGKRRCWREAQVSIPYLRVTHGTAVRPRQDEGMFQSPIYGSRTRGNLSRLSYSCGFQSPIYGSRTGYWRVVLASDQGFNPLSTGHAQREHIVSRGAGRVSIPYLRVTHPIEGGHAQRLGRVSIPYLRVTHLVAAPLVNDVLLVSIPYLRVTHGTGGSGGCYPEWFQSPIYGSRTKFTAPGMDFGVPVSIPYLRVTHYPVHPCFSGHQAGFNPLSTGHARECECGTKRSVVGFQSPIYGSRTEYSARPFAISAAFQSPIYGSRTPASFPGDLRGNVVSIPYLRVTHHFLFNVTKTFRLFQSPIYGSRTLIKKLLLWIVLSFNPLSTGHALQQKMIPK